MKKKTLFSKELVRVFTELEGILIIKGDKSWTKFITEYGFTQDELHAVFSSAYKVGKVQIVFARDPKLVNSCITLE